MTRKLSLFTRREMNNPDPHLDLDTDRLFVDLAEDELRGEQQLTQNYLSVAREIIRLALTTIAGVGVLTGVKDFALPPHAAQALVASGVAILLAGLHGFCSLDGFRWYVDSTTSEHRARPSWRGCGLPQLLTASTPPV